MLKCILLSKYNTRFLLTSLVYATTLSVKTFLGGKVQQHGVPVLLQMYHMQL